MEKVWLKHYQEGVPISINPDLYSSLNEMLEETCQKYKSKKAYSNFGVEKTFEEIERDSVAIAAYLQSLNLEKGSRIAIMMPNLLQYPILMLGILKAGLVVVNINPLFTAPELENQLKDSGAVMIITLANFAHVLQEVLPKVNLKEIIITEIGDCFPFVKACLTNFVVKYIKKMIKPWQITHYYTFKEILKKGRNLPFKKPDIHGEDVAFLQYTGATTGRAKGIVLTHRNMVANVLQGISWIKPNIKEGAETIITALPLYHIFSLTANGLTFMMIGGHNVLITNPRDIKSLIKEMGRYPFTAITGVNTLFNALLNHADFKKLNFSYLKIALGGGVSIQKKVAELWKKMTGIVLLEAYGLTEASPAVCMNPINLKEFNGSIGLPVSSTDISIRDEKDNELDFNTRGELCVRGPQVMREYWQRPEETMEALKGGWLHTGDIATVDEQGFVRIVDRKKDMIIVSGFNVYPAEVEEVISMLPEVLEVAVIGIPYEMKELIKAFVIKKDPRLTEQQIIAHCRKQLTAYKVPKEIEFRSELPKSNVGKILRRVLREEEMNKKRTHSHENQEAHHNL